MGLLALSVPAGAAAQRTTTSPTTKAPTRTPFSTMVDRARKLAAAPFQPAQKPLSDALRDLDYDGWRSIRFRPEQAIWADASPPLLWQMQLFHPGSHHQRTVEIEIADGGATSPLAWRTDRFRYDPPASPSLADDAKDVGAAGFRLHHPLHRPGVFDEVAVFLGGSYFRILGRHQMWGLSARALAVDVASAQGEEFPFFRAFTIEKPAAGVGAIVVNALLDSASVTGAFRFVIQPGAATVVDVDATVFARRDLARLGLAPLTSMFQRGESRRSVGDVDDFRPEVHDSDGLLLHTGTGERVWRPLRNPKQVGVNAFVDDNPRGFGLLQRDRDFDHYQDLETRAERRPSIWIEPKGAWGKGHVELVELPTDDEYQDNIVAYWTAQTPLRAGTSRSYAYRLAAMLEEPAGGDGRVTSTRSGNARSMGRTGAAEQARLFIVDFEGSELEQLDETQPVTASLSTSRGVLGLPIVQKNAVTKGWRAAFVFTPDDGVADVRLALQLNGRTLTETWTLPCP